MSWNWEEHDRCRNSSMPCCSKMCNAQACSDDRAAMIAEGKRLEAAFENGNKWLDEVTAERDQLREFVSKLQLPGKMSAVVHSVTTTGGLCFHGDYEDCDCPPAITTHREDCAGCAFDKLRAALSGSPDSNQEGETK